MARKIKSQSMGVSTMFSPLSSQLELKPQGDIGLRQWYYGTAGTWNPDHYETSLIIKPVVTVVDPETGQSYKPTISSVVWTEVDKDGNETSFSTSITGYSVGGDGTLVMTKNVKPVQDNIQQTKPFIVGAVTLRCRYGYKDSRTGETEYVEESVTVDSSLSSEENYSIIIADNHKYYDPLSGDPMSADYAQNAIRTFTAKARLGDDDVTSKVKFFWYYYEGSTPYLVDDSEHPCLAYVSGQGTATITLNADYEDEDLELFVRIAKSTTATVPDVEHVMGRATLRWLIDEVKGKTYTENGEVARQTIKSHTFGVLYKQRDRDIPDAISEARIFKEWTLKRWNKNAQGNIVQVTESLGSGHKITVDESKLINSYDRQVDVIPDSTIMSPYKVLTFVDNGVTKVITQDGKIIVGMTK